MMTEPSKIPRNHWQDKDVERHWDSVASIYIDENEKVHDTHIQRFKKAVEYLQLKPASKVLNISSRDCCADDYIKADCPGAEVTNAEISQGLIDLAASIRPQAKQVKIETYSKLPFENNYYNRIISLETLEHVSEPIKFLKELHRVSTADAIMVLSCPPASCELAYQIHTKLFGGHGEGPHKFPSSITVKKMLKATNWKLTIHEATLLIPVGPKFLKNFGEKIIQKFQNTFIAELGIRQFYVYSKF